MSYSRLVLSIMRYLLAYSCDSSCDSSLQKVPPLQLFHLILSGCRLKRSKIWMCPEELIDPISAPNVEPQSNIALEPKDVYARMLRSKFPQRRGGHSRKYFSEIEANLQANGFLTKNRPFSGFIRSRKRLRLSGSCPPDPGGSCPPCPGGGGAPPRHGGAQGWPLDSNLNSKYEFDPVLISDFTF